MNSPKTRTYLLLIIACLIVSFFCLAYPIYVIRPFRHQGERELAVALDVLRFRPIALVLCLAAALFAVVGYWRVQPRRWRRIAALAGLAGVGLFAGLSRVNTYEIMFHPMGRPTFTSSAGSKLESSEKVIAVNVAGVARAYPIRIISYHHIVNDTVGGVPIVATY